MQVHPVSLTAADKPRPHRKPDKEAAQLHFPPHHADPPSKTDRSTKKVGRRSRTFNRNGLVG